MSQIGDTTVANAVFHVRARAELRTLPRAVRKRVGAALWNLQLGHRLKMPLSRQLPGVASGVHELRLHDETRDFRVIYCLRPGFGVLVVSAFEKRTARTPLRELALARRRLKDLLHEAT
jgi:phage-related protein